jgi:RimJ/RimL family protein N-acetyltransferase
MDPTRMPAAHDENRDDETESRRWWSRLRPTPAPRPSTVGSAARPEKGEIVREGELVRLRKHTVENRPAFQRWYADHDIARLLRHDLRPLTPVQSLVYFDTVILPSSARGLSCAIHDRVTDELIGTTGLTEIDQRLRTCYFRILVGESQYWNRGYGKEATRLMMLEAFERHGLDTVRLEVFDYNQRAIAAYERVGFVQVGEHTEWPEIGGPDLHVLEMRLSRKDFIAPSV